MMALFYDGSFVRLKETTSCPTLSRLNVAFICGE
ncbi:conserved hypothetical protein [Vibrio cholerae O1 str. 2010EL-1786]|uniref:Uncharacterized protein n=1 Tax=Vibrio cholerae serotype O1 (strain ATCC 39315 / El Tor Inaba N16961) TaxID=243277 RepID=Q9KNW9_VIBCH|nr:hypothetical protein VC_2611 [Vibrio cholerae O1 biovar El Tor str. N16961]ACQ59921.1 hypothetical protein VCD_001752 [Vibrio cholerae MJ-1236]AET27690.1 conserved hypothetical protein [Vibrio cholerae O1 str. 2010EL-1786]EEO10899.1 hypothetical protein VCC_000881 [Vibrio cholerae RC9]EEO18152.1 hypothetical protein VCE_001141 [Vibrio cholerae B33]EEO19763.1 hypothetical protein VCF_002562 [Vibrio cholerae BX 330286]